MDSNEVLKELRNFVTWSNDGHINEPIKTKQTLRYANCVASAFDGQYGERESHEYTGLRASQLGKPAVLQALNKLGLKRKGESVNNKLRGIFHTGEVFECFVLEMLRLYGFKVSHEQEEVEFEGIKGHIDAVIEDKVVIEVKTMSTQYAMSFMKKPNDVRGYVSQLAIYQNTMQRPGAWLIYDKGMNETKMRAFDQDDYAPSLERARSVIKAMQDVKTFEDIFEHFQAPEPEPYVCKKKPTELFVVPEALRYEPSRHIFYKIETQKDCYGKPREFVLDYNGVDEAKQVLDEMLGVAA